jgi:hypothetical protein
MNKAKTILLMEDNSQAEMLTMQALSKVNPANQVNLARDSQQALDFLFRVGEFTDREGPDLQAVIRLK